jgi:hypothetical protein
MTGEKEPAVASLTTLVIRPNMPTSVLRAIDAIVPKTGLAKPIALRQRSWTVVRCVSRLTPTVVPISNTSALPRPMKNRDLIQDVMRLHLSASKLLVVIRQSARPITEFGSLSRVYPITVIALARSLLSTYFRSNVLPTAKSVKCTIVPMTAMGMESVVRTKPVFALQCSQEVIAVSIQDVIRARLYVI